MNKKNGIVLLITLFFISAISILILQNLKDTEKFIKEVSFDSSLTQVQITIDNIQQEVPKFLKKNKDNIDIILENSLGIPFQVGNVDILLNIEDYPEKLFYINSLKAESMTSEDFVNNINYKYDFLQLVNASKPYTNDKQVQQTIKEYIRLTKDDYILNIKDEFGHIKLLETERLIQCSYFLRVDDISVDVSFIFDLSNSTIKEFNILNIF